MSKRESMKSELRLMKRVSLIKSSLDGGARLSRLSLKPSDSDDAIGPLGMPLSRAKGSAKNSRKSLMHSRLESPEEEAWSESALESLSSSYADWTGNAMPADKPPAQVYAELQALVLDSWAGEDASGGARTAGTEETISALRKGVARVSTVLGKPREKEPDPEATAAEEGEQDWDPDMVEMLKDSYREVTGRMMPAGMSPAAAMAELKSLTVAAWQDDLEDLAEGDEGDGEEEEAAEVEAKVEAKADAEASARPADQRPRDSGPPRSIWMLPELQAARPRLRDRPGTAVPVLQASPHR